MVLGRSGWSCMVCRCAARAAAVIAISSVIAGRLLLSHSEMVSSGTRDSGSSASVCCAGRFSARRRRRVRSLMTLGIDDDGAGPFDALPDTGSRFGRNGFSSSLKNEPREPERLDDPSRCDGRGPRLSRLCALSRRDCSSSSLATGLPVASNSGPRRGRRGAFGGMEARNGEVPRGFPCVWEE